KRAYCLKTQPATGETYPKSDLFNKAGGNPYRFWAVKIFEGNSIALVLIPVIFLLCLWLYRVTKKQLKAEEVAENEAASADIPLAK
ncbi:hypothetical protein NL311_20670, partial [Klebsiella pneumoniae]|nr:hypothetical protein [Klebsiella pneumoniae]